MAVEHQEDSQILLEQIMPQIAAQLRGAMGNIHTALTRLVPEEMPEGEGSTGQSAAILCQSYYRLLRLVNNLSAAPLISQTEPLETRNANASGAGQITIRDLIKSSLRMRPERIIVGEVRGGEALDMLQAMNTGHDGSLSTGHANSTEDMLSRLETMVLQGAAGLPLEAIRQQIASAVDIIIHLSRLRDKSRKTMEITEVVGYEDGRIVLNPLYVFEEDENSTLTKVSGRLKRTEYAMKNDHKLRLAGFQETI